MLAEKKRGGGGGKGDLFGWSIYACAYTMYAREHVGICRIAVFTRPCKSQVE